MLNVVTPAKRKMLSRLDQNGKWSGPDASLSAGTDVEPPANSCDLPRSTISAERGKPVVLPQGTVSREGGLWGGG